MFRALTQTLAQGYVISPDPTVTTSSSSSGSMAVLWIIYAVLVVLMIAAMWKIFAKAGKPGWAALIPFYNTYVMLKIVGRPGWWLILFFIPIVNFIVAIVVYYDLVKSFGKGVGYLLFLLFLPFIAFPVLGFGSAKYRGPAVK